MKNIQVDNLTIGINHPCVVIAEAGVNHNGQTELAHKLVDAAADSGADIVKFQTFCSDDLMTKEAPKADYQIKTTGDSETQHDLISKLELPLESYQSLKQHANDRGLLFISTPFDFQSLEFLEKLGVPAIKVPSGEINNIDLLRQIASKGKPLLISTGMANLDEVKFAVETVYNSGADKIALFQCTSNYPTRPEDVNLKAMKTLEQAFDVPVGLSDHTLGWEIAIAAVAMGAKLIEKHLTLDCKLPGPDHQASMNPQDFASMIKGIRNVESAMGTGIKEPVTSELEVSKVARRSLVASQDLKEGVVIGEEHICCKRPGTGIPPTKISMILGKKVKNAIKKGKLVLFEDLVGS